MGKNRKGDMLFLSHDMTVRLDTSQHQELTLTSRCKCDGHCKLALGPGDLGNGGERMLWEVPVWKAWYLSALISGSQWLPWGAGGQGGQLSVFQ